VDLLVDVLMSLEPDFSNSLQTNSAFDAIRTEVRRFRDALWGSLGIIFATIIGRADWDDQVRAARRKVVDNRITTITHYVLAGIEKGDFASQTDPKRAVDQVIGVIVMRRFVREDTLTDIELDELLKNVLLPMRK
jgi:hypothetical protein